MAGSVVSVLLRAPLTDAQHRDLDRWLVEISAHIDGVPDDREVWLNGAGAGHGGDSNEVGDTGLASPQRA